METMPYTFSSADSRKPRPQHPLASGAKLSPSMTVERVLGTGATSFVYAVQHVYFSEPVAVKVPRLRGCSRAEARRWLEREARIYTQLSDPRIPRAYYVDQLPDGSPCLVMELITGVTLRTLFGAGALPPALASRLMSQLLEVLQQVHAGGILHRDVKPGNVVLSRRGEDKVRLHLLDFGLATWLRPDADEGAMLEPALAGTPNYMPPELLGGSAPDLRSDVYAVGVVLYQALTNALPYRGEGKISLVNAILNEAPIPAREHVPDLPPPLCALLERAIAKRPAERFQSAGEMASALAQVMEASP